MNKTVKHCGVCQGNFGDRFSFCPVCGEPLKTVEVGQNQAFAAPAPIPAEEVAAATVTAAPMIESSAQFVHQGAVESSNGASSKFQDYQQNLPATKIYVKKLVVPVKQLSVKPINAGTRVSKKSFYPTFVIATAAAILIVFGAALALFNTQILSSRKVDSNSFKSMPSFDSNIIAKEEISPQNVDKTVSPQTIFDYVPAQHIAFQVTPLGEAEESDLIPLGEVEESDKKDEVLVTASSPLAVFKENRETIRQQEKPILLPKTDVNRKSLKNSAIKEQSLNQPEQASVEKGTVKYKNQKKTGFKGFLNKIGSGLLYVPKIIYKKLKK